MSKVGYLATTVYRWRPFNFFRPCPLNSLKIAALRQMPSAMHHRRGLQILQQGCPEATGGT